MTAEWTGPLRKPILKDGAVVIVGLEVNGEVGKIDEKGRFP